MYSGASPSDWTPVVFHKRSASDVAKQTVLQKKKTSNSSASAQTDVNTYKLEEDDHVQIEHVSSELKQQIIKARTAAKLTQSQLAQRINEQPKVIQEYENGKAIPNNAILQKMSKILGVTLKKRTASQKSVINK